MNLDYLRSKLVNYQNTLVISLLDDIVRLVDVIEQDDDFYWVYDSRIRGIYYSSCVGSWIPLKGHLKEDDYNRLVYTWNLNNIEKAI